MRADGDTGTDTAFRPDCAFVSSIALSNFRNYQRCEIEIDRPVVVLTGHNGAGKTNILEAVSLLAPGTGLRNARLDEMDRTGSGPWAIQSAITLPDGGFDIATRRDPAKERRLVSINGKAVSSSAGLAEIMAILWLTPAFDRLFVEAGSSRRRFLDRLVLAVTSSHASQVREFERAMRERLRLLREPRPDPAWLTVLERRMAEAGVAIAAARIDLVKHLQSVIDRRLDPFDRPKLQLKGDIERWLESSPALEVEERIGHQLAANRGIDAETGRTELGTHRTDLAVFDYETMEPAGSCSTGRQKALLIAIILAEARLRQQLRGALPMLLLDEITAHLDAGKRAALMASIESIGAQAWLTGTDASLFDGLCRPHQVIDIHQGKLETR
jgi:DNA replication and repair protein RecF